MNISDIVRMQTSFQQKGQESKIGKKIAEKVKDYNVIQELLGKKLKDKKGKNKAQEAAVSATQANPAYNLSLSGPRPPMWDGFYTKREPAMSDEEFEEAIKALALEYAERAVEIGNSGKSASMINRELFNFNQEFVNGKKGELEVLYVSVVSPDRKAAYAKADFTTSNSVYGNEKTLYGNTGNELMTWGPSGWSVNMTQAEFERMKKFNNLFIDTLKAYEAEHGIEIPYSTISKAVAPVRNYL